MNEQNDQETTQEEVLPIEKLREKTRKRLKRQDQTKEKKPVSYPKLKHKPI